MEEGAPRELNRAPTRRISLVAIVILCVTYVLATPHQPAKVESIDHHLAISAMDQMREGENYYDAMDVALREVYGPAETPRAYRSPAIFLVWRALPSEMWIWYLYVGLVALSGWFVVVQSRHSIIGILVAAYLLSIARLRGGDGLVDQYAIVELWVLPAALGAFYGLRSGRWRLAAGLALVSSLIRELAIGLLVGGFSTALRSKRPLYPWIGAIVATAAFYLMHLLAVDPHLVTDGHETPLLGTGSVMAVLRIMGFGLPGGTVVGPILWALAIVRLRLDQQLLIALAPYLALPLLGLLADRPYWGILVVPFTLMLASDLIPDQRMNRMRSTTAS